MKSHDASAKFLQIFVFSVLLFAFAIPSIGQDKFKVGFRTWETSNGRKSDVKLKLMEVGESGVQLLREDDGKTVTLKLSQLSKKDQRYVQRQLDKLKEPEAPKLDSRESSSEGSLSRITTWSQWRGDKRDGKSSARNLLAKWESTPKVNWVAQGFGEGYSTPSATSEAIFVLGTEGARELLFCVDWNGDLKWKTAVGNKTNGGGYPGPRGTPTVHDGIAYSITSDGTISAVDTRTGKLNWQRNMKSDFRGECGHWGFAESPLVDDNKLICTPGGSENTIVALNLKNGKPLWSGSADALNRSKSGYTLAGYASPIVAEIRGARQYIVFLNGGVVSFLADRGRPLWHYESPANDTANCSTPVASGDAVFAASGYGTGGGKVTVQRNGDAWDIREDFFVRKMQNHHGGFVLHEGHIYGTNENSLLCIDWETGQVQWQDRCVGKGAVSLADGKLYVRGENGRVALVEATPSGFKQLGQFSQPQRSGNPAWPHPVIANGKLILRDTDKIICFDIGS